VRCPRCGNENPDNNRFCGMCGATLLAPPAVAPPQPVSVAAPKPPAVEAAAAPAPAPDPRRSATVVSESPAISGPSFLGLNQPASSPRSSRKRASLSIDPHSAQGSNLDYLLDEEEPNRPWGIGKILVIMIALGLAVGFGYLRFKNQGLAWLSGLKKPASVAQNSTSPDAANQPAPSSSVTPETQPPAQPTPQPSLPGPSTGQPINPPETSIPVSSSPANPAPTDTAKPADTAKPPDAAPEPAPTEKATPPADTSSHPTDDSADTPAAASTPPESSKPAPKSPAPKPSAASKPAVPYDPVSEAQKYLYGRGASQDCDRGMRLLKPQANKANPKAMIEMGALYSAGLCTPRDLPTAYRWFAMALRKDPDNTALHADLTKLWGEMTQPERQLAIKMTQ
jgi:zinc-ribbon domain